MVSEASAALIKLSLNPGLNVALDESICEMSKFTTERLCNLTVHSSSYSGTPHHVTSLHVPVPKIDTSLFLVTVHHWNIADKTFSIQNAINLLMRKSLTNIFSSLSTCDLLGQEMKSSMLFLKS